MGELPRTADQAPKTPTRQPDDPSTNRTTNPHETRTRNAAQAPKPTLIIAKRPPRMLLEGKELPRYLDCEFSFSFSFLPFFLFLSSLFWAQHGGSQAKPQPPHAAPFSLLGSAWGFAGKTAALPMPPFFCLRGRQGSSQVNPQPPHCRPFVVGVGAREFAGKAAAFACRPFLFSGSAQGIAGKTAAPLCCPFLVIKTAAVVAYQASPQGRAGTRTAE